MLQVSYKLAMAAGRDAADRRMKKAGRARWNLADYKHAARIVARLMAQKDIRK